MQRTRKQIWFQPRFLLVPSFALVVMLCFVIGTFLPFAAGPLVGARFTKHVWPTYLITTLLTCYFLSAALLRAGLRLFPLRADLVVRKRVVWLSGWIFALALAATGVVASLFRRSTMDVIWGNPWPLVMFNGSALVSLTAGRFFWLHQSVGRIIARPFILFLRRFAGFSDRSTFIEILRSAPPGIPVYVVAGPMRDAAAWDPFLLCFHGMKLRTASSSPVFWHTTDDTWITDVARLVMLAQCILIDVSDISNSMRAEIDLAKTRDPAAVIWLCASRGPLNPDLGSEARVALYEKSWVASLPRLGVGLVLGSLTVTLTVLASRGASVLVDNGRWTITPVTATTMFSPAAIAAVLVLFGPLFFRQSLSRNSSRLLRRAIRSAAAVIGSPLKIAPR